MLMPNSVTSTPGGMSVCLLHRPMAVRQQAKASREMRGSQVTDGRGRDMASPRVSRIQTGLPNLSDQGQSKETYTSQDSPALTELQTFSDQHERCFS